MRLSGLLCLLALVGCTSGSSALYHSVLSVAQGSPKVPALQQVSGRTPPILTIIHADGRQTRMALGYTEPPPPPLQGQATVWFSADRAMIKLWQGRILASAGWPVDWRAVRLPQLPDWSQLSAEGVIYLRERDVMPGYRYGLKDNVLLRPMTITAIQRAQLSSAIAAHWHWYEEISLDGQLPTTWFAIDPGQPDQPVLYSRQCFAPGHCVQLHLPTPHQRQNP